MKITLTLNDL